MNKSLVPNAPVVSNRMWKRILSLRVPDQACKHGPVSCEEYFEDRLGNADVFWVMTDLQWRVFQVDAYFIRNNLDCIFVSYTMAEAVGLPLLKEYAMRVGSLNNGKALLDLYFKSAQLNV